MIFSTKTKSVQSFQSFASVKSSHLWWFWPQTRQIFGVLLVAYGKANSAKLGVELCESCDLGWRYAPRSDMAMPWKSPCFFQWEIHRLHSWLGIFNPLFWDSSPGISWDFIRLDPQAYEPPSYPMPPKELWGLCGGGSGTASGHGGKTPGRNRLLQGKKSWGYKELWSDMTVFEC